MNCLGVTDLSEFKYVDSSNYKDEGHGVEVDQRNEAEKNKKEINKCGLGMQRKSHHYRE